MKKNMNIETFLDSRNLWQDNTIENIKNRILFKSENLRTLKKSEKIVAIYGSPQIGKTTLILYLLGIEHRYQKVVYDILRGNIKRGNSSTSTAIIYQKSENDLFGMHYGTELDSLKSNIKYYSDSDVVAEFDKIRKQVEIGKANNDILYVYIPQKYFSDNSTKYDNINILDLPGDGSRNLKEHNHVDFILEKYMSLSTVNIITCKANEIQSLENMAIPSKVDWKELPHRYIVVVTNAYGQGNIKAYFNKSHEERCITGECFSEFLKNEYSKAMIKILPCNMEFYPIDIGDSLDRLMSSELISQNYKEIIQKKSYDTAEEIRKSIQARKGNSLKSTILDLKERSENIMNYRVSELENRISDIKHEIDEIQKDINKYTGIMSKYVLELESLRVEYEDFQKRNNCENAWEFKVHEDVIRSAKNKYLNRYFSHIDKKASFGNKIKDKDKELINKCNDELIEFTRDAMSILKEDLNIDFDEKNEENIFYEIIETPSFEIDTIEKLYKNGIFKKKATTEDFKKQADMVYQSYANVFLEIVEKKFLKTIESLRKYKNEYDNFISKQHILENSLKNKNIKLNDLESDLKCFENEKNELIKEYSNDKIQLKEYLKIAKDEFLSEKQKIKNFIYDKDTSKSEKILSILLLGIIEKDYKRIKMYDS